MKKCIRFYYKGYFIKRKCNGSGGYISCDIAFDFTLVIPAYLRDQFSQYVHPLIGERERERERVLTGVVKREPY